MKRFLTMMLVGIAMNAMAGTDDYTNMEPLKLTVPEMKAELGTVTNEEYDLGSPHSQDGFRLL